MRSLQDTVRDFTSSQIVAQSEQLLLVNTDQTSHMDKSIRDYQAQSLPLKRFAEVCGRVFYWVTLALMFLCEAT